MSLLPLAPFFLLTFDRSLLSRPMFSPFLILTSYFLLSFANGPQRAVNPPSIIILCPVTKDALSEHSHKTASATSSTRPSRPIGWNVVRSFFFVHPVGETIDHLRIAPNIDQPLPTAATADPSSSSGALALRNELD